MAADRNFLIIAHRARTAPDWKLDDLCGGGGRLDVLGRCVTAEDVAESMMSLVRGNRSVTGEILVVDGGFSAST